MIKGHRKAVQKKILQLRGSWKAKNREDDPAIAVAGGIPEPPKVLTGAALEEWNRLTVELDKTGILTMLDMEVLATFCKVYVRWCEAEAELDKGALVVKAPNTGYPILNPYLGIANRALDQLRKLANELGLSPAARSSLSIVRTKERTEAAKKLLRVS